MILLIDIGNTHTHLGWAQGTGSLGPEILRQRCPRGAVWKGACSMHARKPVTGACLCSVVPAAGPARRAVRAVRFDPEIVSGQTAFPASESDTRPDSIGPDRLANAVAATRHFGAPVVVVDFGTAVTFDVVDADSHYVGGIIAPGIAMMTDYLHERTALLPRVRIREQACRGKKYGTGDAGWGGRGIPWNGRGLIHALREELGQAEVPVVATGATPD